MVWFLFSQGTSKAFLLSRRLFTTTLPHFEQETLVQTARAGTVVDNAARTKSIMLFVSVKRNGTKSSYPREMKMTCSDGRRLRNF